MKAYQTCGNYEEEFNKLKKYLIEIEPEIEENASRTFKKKFFKLKTLDYGTNEEYDNIQLTKQISTLLAEAEESSDPLIQYQKLQLII